MTGDVYKSELEFIQYGTRLANEKSGAYLFLPDGDAKVRNGCKKSVSKTMNSSQYGVI